MRGRVILGGAALLAGLGCGTRLPLPNEIDKGRTIPSDHSYQMVATWTGMSGIADILLTQGRGSQLFLLFSNAGATGPAARGRVKAFARTRPDSIPGIEFPTLFNPVALCSGDGKVFVLDQGDTCLARINPSNGRCDSTAGWDNRITDLSKYWRVREYGLLGGDTISTFTDTTLSFVNGIAADEDGNVYVAGVAILIVPDPRSPRLFTRTTQFRVYRYRRGLKPSGDPDFNMPGANWHRDESYVIEEGSGVGSVVDPRGMHWSPAGGRALYVSDTGKNWTQKVAEQGSSYQLDGGATGTAFIGPLDVSVDLSGFVYVADTGNQRVLRYAPDASFVQRVDVEPDAQGLPLGQPVTVAADDSLVYVGDSQTGKVIRYKRRP
jgi:hypothetical protein